MAIAIIILLALLISNKRRVVIQQGILLSVVLVTLFTYALGVLNLLKYLPQIKMVLTVVLILNLILEGKKGNLSIQELRGYFTKSSAVTLIAVTGIFFLMYGKEIIDWDDLSHWGTYVKQMFYIHKIPVQADSISGYVDYQPAGAMYLYWFISDFSAFPEKIVRALWCAFTMVLLVPFWNLLDETRESKMEFVLQTICCILLPMLFVANSIISLRGDSVVALVFLYALISLSKKKIADWTTYDFVENTLMMSLMLLSKSVALLLWGFLLLCAFEKKAIKAYLKYLGSMILAFLFGWTWTIFCDYMGNSSYISEGFSNIQIKDYVHVIAAFVKGTPIFVFPVMLAMFLIILGLLFKEEFLCRHKNLLSIVFGVTGFAISLYGRYMGGAKQWEDYLAGSGDYNRYMAAHYWYGLLCQPITFLRDRIEIGPSIFEVLIVAFLIMILLLDSKKTSESLNLQKKRCYIFTILFVLLLTYILGQLAIYIFLFSKTEASRLAAFNRYLAMPMTGLMGVVLFWGLSLGKMKLRYALYLFIIYASKWTFALNCIFMPRVGMPGELLQHREEYKGYSEEVKSILGADIKYVLVGNDDASWFENEMRYLLIPARPGIGMEVLDYLDESQVVASLETKRADYIIVNYKSITGDALNKWNGVQNSVPMKLIYKGGIEIYEFAN